MNIIGSKYSCISGHKNKDIIKKKDRIRESLKLSINKQITIQDKKIAKYVKSSLASKLSKIIFEILFTTPKPIQ